jgi:UDP-N-acetylglucosamine 2-epimerase
LGVLCITVREETEWIETVETAWNVLVGTDKAKIVKLSKYSRLFAEQQSRNVYGDGKAAKRVIDILAKL